MGAPAGELLAWLWLAVKILSLAAIVYVAAAEARRYRRRLLERRGDTGEGAQPIEPSGPEETPEATGGAPEDETAGPPTGGSDTHG